MPRASLVEFLLAGTKVADAAAARIQHSFGWSESVRLASEWGALPRLEQRVRALAHPPAQPTLERIAQLTAESYTRSILQAQGGLAVLRALAQANIRAVAFKGLASMATLYRDPKQRLIVDADLLIHEDDLPRAAELLRGIGFSAGTQAALPEYREFVRRAPGFGGNEELSFQNARGTCIDLHWRLGAGFDPQTLLERARPVELLGTTFSAVSPQDGLLLTVHHSLRNHFSPDAIIRDLLDLELWCAELLRTDEVDRCLGAAARQGLLVPLLALTGILRAFDAACAAARVASQVEERVSAGQRRSADSLRDLFATQVAEGQIERDLLYLFRPSEGRQILRGLLFGGRRHWKIAQSMDATLAGAPVSMWQRVAAIGRSLRGVRPRHVRMLRALARTKDEFGRAR